MDTQPIMPEQGRDLRNKGGHHAGSSEGAPGVVTVSASLASEPNAFEHGDPKKCPQGLQALDMLGRAPYERIY